jgi:hypothetical protein
MPLTSDFTDYWYEPAYRGDYDYTANPGVTYDIVDTAGGRMDGTIIYLDPLDESQIFKFDAVLNVPEGLGEVNVYARTEDECIETDYCKLHRQSEEEGIDRFSLSIQRRFLAQYEIELFAVRQETGEAFLLDTLEVRYDE